MWITFSIVFLIFERREIGLWLVQSNLESFLKFDMTCASLQMFVNDPLEMEPLISWERGKDIVSLNIFMILVGIL